METIYKKQVIKKIKINRAYSPTGKDIERNISLSGIEVSINSLIKIMSLSKYNSIPPSIKEKHLSFFKELNIDYDMNYYPLLGDKLIKDYLSEIKRFISESKSKITSYHLKYFPTRKKVCENLSQLSLDDKLLEVPKYNHESVTGRSSISSGFNFMTMKKSERKNLTPIDDNDMLVEVDFKSCEPFFYINALNKFNDHKIEDVYDFISKSIGFEYKSRPIFKRGVLSVIYGANEETASKIMRCDIKNVKKIKELLEIESFEKSLKDSFEKENCIFNYYGRPILNDSNLVNYWIQSSTADFCFLAFDNFIKEYNLRPCFYIHDSMTFLIEKDRFEAIKNIKSILEPYSRISIPVEIIKY